MVKREFVEAAISTTKESLLEDIEAGAVSGLVVSYIKREPVLIDNSAGGNTVGQIMDKMIGDAISAGDRISSFTINVTERDWNMWRG